MGLYKLVTKKLTKEYSEIPLFFVNFNYDRYKTSGAKDSCIAKIHPILKDDDNIKNMLNDLVDYIRNNYDMEGVK